MPAVNERVALLTQRDQILLAILPIVAAELFMMNLEQIVRAAVLAHPPVSSQDLQTERCIGLGIQTHGDVLGKNSSHEAFPSSWVKNSSFWVLGRSLKSPNRLQ